jgi:hypothetical protein
MNPPSQFAPSPEGQQRESRIFSVKGLARGVARVGVQGRVWVWLGLGYGLGLGLARGVVRVQGQGMGVDRVLSYGYQGCVDSRVGLD